MVALAKTKLKIPLGKEVLKITIGSLRTIFDKMVEENKLDYASFRKHDFEDIPDETDLSEFLISNDGWRYSWFFVKGTSEGFYFHLNLICGGLTGKTISVCTAKTLSENFVEACRIYFIIQRELYEEGLLN